MTPKKFSLKQNYPNPFNPTTKIVYELPKNCNVTLEVYNVLGQKVITLVNNRLQLKGKHSVVWNAKDVHGNNLSTGIYFYRIKAGDFIQSKKMILIK